MAKRPINKHGDCNTSVCVCVSVNGFILYTYIFEFDDTRRDALAPLFGARDQGMCLRVCVCVIG